MANVDVTFSLGTVPAGFCHTSWQNTFQTLVDNLTGTLPLTTSTLIRSTTTPGQDESNSVWVRIEADGNIEGTYTWNTTLGGWARQHHIPASDKRTWFYRGSTVEITTLDGGNANPVSAADGPFWQVDTDMEGRFPLGVPSGGAMPTTGTQIDLGDTGGEEKHELILEEITRHDHMSKDDYSRSVDFYGPNTRGPTITTDTTSDTKDTSSFIAVDPAGGNATLGDGHSVPHNTMPPYRAGYWIKRTARTHYLYT